MERRLLKETYERLVVVSNRLPVRIEKEHGEWSIQSAVGGLVTALSPVLKDWTGLWIGWSGTTVEAEAPLDTLLPQAGKELGYRLSPVPLTKEEVEGFYLGFANQILWPLFHDLLGQCNFDPAFWQAYLQGNRKFAESILASTRRDDFLWVHDYHLIPLGEELHRHGFRGTLAFFLHTPFPPPDIFMRLPWRQQLVRALFFYHLVGFQTRRDYLNFVQCVRLLLPEARVESTSAYSHITFLGRRLLVQAFPISIDYQEFNKLAQSKEVQDEAWYHHEKYPEKKIILGVDRADYTKGIPLRIRGYEMCLKKYPELREKIVFLQLLVPSRSSLAQYMELKKDLDELVGQLMGDYCRPGWAPIEYYYHALPRKKLVTWYRAADIALVTPIKDGMNLVAKEYVASSPDDGVLILSEFAGAAGQLKEGALLVNPYDLEGVADAIHRACTMPQEERLRRLMLLRNQVRNNDIFLWVNNFLSAASFGKRPKKA